MIQSQGQSLRAFGFRILSETSFSRLNPLAHFTVEVTSIFDGLKSVVNAPLRVQLKGG